MRHYENPSGQQTGSFYVAVCIPIVAFRSFLFLSLSFCLFVGFGFVFVFGRVCVRVKMQLAERSGPVSADVSVTAHDPLDLAATPRPVQT